MKAHAVSRLNNFLLSRYLYKRLRFLGNKLISHFVTLVFVALWHGIAPGFFLCFIGEFVVIVAEQQVGKQIIQMLVSLRIRKAWKQNDFWNVFAARENKSDAWMNQPHETESYLSASAWLWVYVRSYNSCRQLLSQEMLPKEFFLLKEASRLPISYIDFTHMIWAGSLLGTGQSSCSYTRTVCVA